MHQKHFSVLAVVGAFIASVSLAGVTVAGQSPAPAGKAGKSWTAPRGPDGHPDISGTWEHNAATPLERPDELAGRATLTDEELAAMQATAGKLFSGDGDAAFGDSVYIATLRNVLGAQKGFKSRDVSTGDYNAFWVIGRWFEKRTSLVTDPPTGKIPPLTADARKRREQRGGTSSAPPLRRPGGYRARPAVHYRQRTDARCRVQQLLSDRSDTVDGRHWHGDAPRHAHDSYQ